MVMQLFHYSCTFTEPVMKKVTYVDSTISIFVDDTVTEDYFASHD